MKLIAHRGNVSGKNVGDENKPKYILEAIAKGYDVELDLWEKGNELWLGHDEPKYKINLSFLKTHKEKFWVHAKNLNCVNLLSKTNLNWFWHEQDKCTLTSKGYIWTYPEVFLNESIVNQPSTKSKFWALFNKMNFVGLCMDDFSKWENITKTGSL